MPISEAARADLYTGLAKVLGPERAENLMAQLPKYDPDRTALNSDFADLKAELAELRAELRGGLATLNERFDRLYLTMLVGMFGIVATMIGVILSVR